MKGIDETSKGNRSVFLIPFRPETKYTHEIIVNVHILCI
jgi:hypothetical protein